MAYNFCKIHGALRVTPAMAAGVTDKLWDIADVVRMVDDFEREPEAFYPTAEEDLARLREHASSPASFVPNRIKGPGSSMTFTDGVKDGRGRKPRKPN